VLLGLDVGEFVVWGLSAGARAEVATGDSTAAYETDTVNSTVYVPPLRRHFIRGLNTCTNIESGQFWTPIHSFE